jgi:hypothetical protein
MNRADMEPVIAYNIRVRQAFGAALLSLEGMTQPQFAAQYPGADLAALTSDQDFMRQVELFASNPAVQDHALDAQLRRGLSESVTGFAAKMQAPDISGPALAAATDALTKITNLMDKREAARREGGEQGLIRQLYKAWGEVSIRTIEGVTDIKLAEYLTYEQNLAAVSAMRCNTGAEAEQVIEALRSAKPVVILNLRGF